MRFYGAAHDTPHDTPDHTRDELGGLLDAFTDDFGPADMERAADALTHRGLLAAGEDGRLARTDTGRDALAEGRRTMAGVRARIHEEEYTAAMDVLRRMIRNTGRPLPES